MPVFLYSFSSQMKYKKSLACGLLSTAILLILLFQNGEPLQNKPEETSTADVDTSETESFSGGDRVIAKDNGIQNEYFGSHKSTENAAKGKKGLGSQTFPTWTDSTLLDMHQSVSEDGSSIHRIRLVQPAGLPYQVRVEERLKTNQASGETEVTLISEVVASRILFGLSPEVSIDILDPFLESVDGKLQPLGGLSNQYCLHLGHVYLDSAVDALAKLRKEIGEHLDYSEFDNILHVAAAPNDPQYTAGQLWGLNNLGQSNGANDADIDAPEAWDKRTDASQVIVAVIDTGVRYTHEDLQDNMWVNSGETPGNGIDDDNNGVIDDIHGYNGIADNGDPNDDNGHGSHCAGTIGAVGNNGIGITGVAWNVQLMACRFLGTNGGGAVSDAIECVDYARNNGAHIMSNSWGGGPFNQSLSNSIDAARNAGILFIAAAGNDSRLIDDANKNYPSSYTQDNVVAVASHDRADQLSTFSNYGAVEVDIAAPGTDILSCWWESDSSYKSISGTSMATPHVSGIMALLKAEFPNDSHTDLIAKLYEGAIASPAYTNKVSTGKRANVDASLNISSTRPLLTKRLSNLNLIAGDTLTLMVEASSELPLTYAWRKGGNVIADANTNTLTIANVTTTATGIYTVTVSNADGSVQSSAEVTILQSRPELATALNTQSGLFASYGDASWRVINTDSQVGDTNAGSGDINSDQSSVLVTRIQGPGDLSFSWRSSSEAGYDVLQFAIDGTVIETLSGEMNWRQFSRTLSENKSYSLSWTYLKDRSVDTGQDGGFVDGFTFTREGESPPVITGQPVSTNVASGGTATFEVTATGQALNYQWQKDRVNLSGQTQATLTLNNASGSDTGVYTVVVSNQFGTATSSEARLSIGNQPPTITTQLQGGTHDAGTAFTFSIGASGTTPFNYVWQKNQADIPGANQSQLQFNSLTVGDSGNYRVKVSNLALPEGVFSNEVTLTVIDVTLVPVITKQPSSRNVANGNSATLTVEVSGDGPFSYQWYKNGVELEGENEASLTLNSISESDAGSYSVQISNTSGTVASESAVITIIQNLGGGTDREDLVWDSEGEALWFIQSAVTHDEVDAVQSGAIGDEQSSILSTVVEGDGIVSFWWKVSSENNWDFLQFLVNGEVIASISGEVDWTQVNYLIEDSFGAELSWVYSKDISVSGGSDAGWVDEFGFTEANSGPPLFLIQPRSVAVSHGADFTFESEVNGAQPVSYQWRKDGINISGATDPALELTSIDGGDLGVYDLLASNSVGSTTSAVATLSLLSGYGVALENSSFDYFSLSESNWFHQSSYFILDGDALRSGDIGHNETTSFSVTVSEPGLVSFHWAVSSEEGFDGLQFYYDDLLVTGISGEVDWTSYAFENRLPGEHTFTWTYEKDDSFSSGLDAGFLDNLIFTPPTFAEAMDFPNSQWDNFSGINARPVTNISHDGTDAVRFGDLSDNEATGLETRVYGETTGSFWWKVSSELGFDGLDFIIDGVVVDSLSGESDWTKVDFSTTGPGLHRLAWRYIKDDSFSDGTDEGWIDEFVTDSLTLPEALDALIPQWTTEPVTPWLAQTGESSDGEDAAQSFPIDHNEFSLLQAQIEGKGYVTFNWKVSSEEDFDELIFLLDDVPLEVISGDVDWTEVFIPILSDGVHTLSWRYEKDDSVNSGDDTAWVDQVFFSNISIGEAVESEEFAWNIFGDGTWVTQVTTTSDGIDALQTNPLTHDQTTLVETTIDGPFGIEFDWKVSSEEDFDILAFFIDYEVVDLISGEVDWTTLTAINNEPGSHTLSWMYFKDESESEGLDSAWLDQVTIRPLKDLPPVFNRSAEAVLADIGADVYLDASVIESSGVTHQWLRNGTELLGETDPLLRISSVQVSDEAEYIATATNANGGADYGPISLSTTTTLGPAVDALDLDWNSRGDMFWGAQTTTTHDGNDALQSGAIVDRQKSSIQATILGHTTLSFWWKVSSEAEFDFLNLYIDDILIASISGEQDWTEVSHDIQTSGLHSVKWEYVKDESISEGIDAGWIDEVSAVSNLTSNYLSWLAEFFTEEELANELIAGENADPDQDFIINLIEYALFLDPLNPSELPKIFVEVVDGVPVAQFTFTRRKQPNDLFYSVEFSNDFDSWVPGGNFSETVVDNQDDTETVTGTITLEDLNNIPLFLRLRITRI